MKYVARCVSWPLCLYHRADCCCCRDETTSGQKQRTADFMLFADIISDFLYRMQTRVQWSARVQSTRADTVKIQPFDVICCHITTQYCSTGRGCVCSLQCPLLQHCMQQAVSPPALPLPPRGAAVPAAGENRNIFTPNFLDGTDWRTQPRAVKHRDHRDDGQIFLFLFGPSCTEVRKNTLISHLHSKATKFYLGSEETRLWMWHSPIRPSVAKLWFVWKAVPSLRPSIVLWLWCVGWRGWGLETVDTSAQLLSAAARCLSCRAVITGGSHRLLSTSTLSTKASNKAPHEGS